MPWQASTMRKLKTGSMGYLSIHRYDPVECEKKQEGAEYLPVL
ncbi:MAG: hypothetical protein ACI9W6_000372 [Motiliproteus sp.]|jgi:hypothetical protein